MNLSTRYLQWLQISMQWNASEDHAKTVFDDLVRRYCANTRFYHSLSHIEMMLKLAEQYQSEVTQWDAIYFAIWFHDAIQGMLVDGEKESALLCKQSLQQLNAPKAMVNATYEMILATKQHKPTHKADLGIFLDLDLAILGADWNQYQEYTKQTRKEYSVPNWMFNRGRKQFLQSKLAQPTLFNSLIFREKYESRARSNMLLEMAHLS